MENSGDNEVKGVSIRVHFFGVQKFLFHLQDLAMEEDVVLDDIDKDAILEMLLLVRRNCSVAFNQLTYSTTDWQERWPYRRVMCRGHTNQVCPLTVKEHKLHILCRPTVMKQPLKPKVSPPLTPLPPRAVADELKKPEPSQKVSGPSQKVKE